MLKKYLKFILIQICFIFILTALVIFFYYGPNNIPKDPPHWFEFLIRGEISLIILYGIDMVLYKKFPNSWYSKYCTWQTNT